MLLLVSIAKLLAEIALLALLGQGLLALLVGRTRAQNPVYRLLQILTSPVLRLTRLLLPRQVLDRHLPLAAVALLLLVWLLSTGLKISHCLRVGVKLCQ